MVSCDWLAAFGDPRSRSGNLLGRDPDWPSPHFLPASTIVPKQPEEQARSASASDDGMTLHCSS